MTIMWAATWVGILGQHPLGHFHGGGAVGAGRVVDGRLQGAHVRIGGGEAIGGVRVGRGVREIAHRQRQLRDLLAALEAVRILLDEAQVLAIRLAQLAPLAEHPGIGQPRLGMIAVEAEDVAELDERPVDLAGGEQLYPALVMRLGAFLGRVAGHERQCEAESKPEIAQRHGKTGGNTHHNTPKRERDYPIPLTTAIRSRQQSARATVAAALRLGSQYSVNW